MKNIYCELPNPNTFKDKLSAHFRGKIFSLAFFCMPSWAMAFAHYLLSISQLWTLLILCIAIMYTAISTEWYMANVYRFFIFSFIGCVFFSSTICYVGILYLSNTGINITLEELVTLGAILFVFLHILEIYLTRKNIYFYQKVLKKSIKLGSENKPVFSIENWLITKYSSEFKTGKAMFVSIVVATIGLVISLFNPLISARILLRNGEEWLVNLVISMGLLTIGIFIISVTVDELLKIVAFYRLKEED